MFDRQQRAQQRQDFFQVQWPQVYNGFDPVGRKRFGTKSNDHYFDIFNDSEYPYPKDDNQIPVKIGSNQSQTKNNQFMQNFSTLNNPLIQENTIQENQIPYEQLQYDHNVEKQVSSNRRQKNNSRNEKYIRLNKSMDQALTERAPLANLQEKSFYYGKRKQQEIQMQNNPNINQLKKIEKPLTKEELAFARKINMSTAYGPYDFIQNKIRLEKLKDLEKQQMRMQKQKELEMKQKNEQLYKQIKYKEALEQQQRIKIQMETNPQDLR